MKMHENNKERKERIMRYEPEFAKTKYNIY